jgi:hypothetical protein
LTSATSDSFTIKVAALKFTQQPTNAMVGSAIMPAVTVAIQDPLGNTVTTDTSSVTITLSSGTFASGSNTATAAAVNGVATFDKLFIDADGNYTLTASDGADTQATSQSFAVTQPILLHSWSQEGVTVMADDPDVGVSLDPDNIQVKFGNGNAVASITLIGSQSMQGLGIAITGATSVGQITDKRKGTPGDLSFINSNASIIAVTLKSGLTGMDWNGVSRAVLSGGILGSFSATGTVAGNIVAAYIGNITVTGGDLARPVVAANGSIGNITVTGGNILGSIVAEKGRIGNITVTGVPVPATNPDTSAGSETTYGGNIVSPLIQASPMNGTAIGNITLTAGSMGSDRTAVRIEVLDADGNVADGNIGNITVKDIRYKSSVRVGFLEWKWITLYQGGGIWIDLDTLGRVGDLTTSGDDLGGDIHAAGGIGNINVDPVSLGKKGTILGTKYVDSDSDIHEGNMTANLSAEPGVGAVAIKSLNVLGGDITGDVTVTGTIGAVTAECIAIYDAEDNDLQLSSGGLSSDTFQASRIGNITLGGDGLSGNVVADSSIGNVTIALGSLTGTLTATNGSVGNITIKGAASTLLGRSISVGLYDGTVTAGQSIGNVSVAGGDLRGTLTASDSIGNITAKSLALWDVDNGEGDILGGNLDVDVELGGSGQDINSAATLGEISGVGVDVTIGGTVPWQPSKARINLKVASYVGEVDEGNGKTRKKVFYLPDGIMDQDTGKLNPSDFIENDLTLAT